MSNDHDRPSGSLAASSRGPKREPDGDLLSDVLETVRLRGAVFFLWEPTRPFATSIPDSSRFAPLIMPGADRIASYHIVIDGPCWGAVANQPPVRLESGDILLVPRGDAYVIADTPQAPSEEFPPPLQRLLQRLAAGDLPPLVRGGGAGPGVNRLLCGFLGCDMQPFNPLLNALPSLLRVAAPEHGEDPLSPMLAFAMREARSTSLGSRSVLRRLSELMFVEVIRRHLRNPGLAGSHWLQGLDDPAVGRALSLLHGRLAEAWTLERLAACIGVSRSVLAERFAQVTGEPPMQYLARWRMQVAAHALVDGRQKVFAVGRMVGYRSEAAFSRAFKRIVGVSPAAWRQARSVGRETADER